MKLTVECFNKVKKDCLKFIKSQETKVDKFKNKERMIKSFLIPLCFWISKKVDKKRPYFVGLAGGQGTGKTTISSLIRIILTKYFDLKVFRISIEDIGKSVTLTLGESDQKHNDNVVPTKEMIIDRAHARALVVGKMNFESFYVGFNGTFKRNPIDIHNVLLIGFLQKFAYVYQKRLVPKSLEEIK